MQGNCESLAITTTRSSVSPQSVSLSHSTHSSYTLCQEQDIDITPPQHQHFSSGSQGDNTHSNPIDLITGISYHILLFFVRQNTQINVDYLGLIFILSILVKQGFQNKDFKKGGWLLLSDWNIFGIFWSPTLFTSLSKTERGRDLLRGYNYRIITDF